MPKPEPLLLTECYADTALAAQLLQRKSMCNHQSGISKVARIMMSDKQAGRTIVGVVDNDKANMPEYFTQFRLI